MAQELTTEESRLECIKNMGENLGELYHYLWQELASLYSKWQEFIELFATKPNRIDLMNESSPYFFRIIEDVLWENIVLSIARLTDSTKSRGKDNLTICKIPDFIIDADFRKDIEAAINIAKKDSNFCRDWRNRRFAHMDYLSLLNKETNQLEIATRERTENALSSVANVLNKVSDKFNNSTTIFNLSGGTLGNANSLLYYIYYGLKAERDRGERIKNCEEFPDDFDHPDI